MDPARIKEEQITASRARMLGLNYLNTAELQDRKLFKDVLPVNDMYGLKTFPIDFGKGFALFAVTITTPQHTFEQLAQRFTDERVTFVMVSETGFKEFMRLYDPPKQVVYQDIAISNAGEENLVQEVSKTLAEVRADDILAYLVKQAHRLNASDIHIENAKNDVGIRFRIDGVLHPIARLSHEKYRTLQSSIAVAGNVSTSAPEAQQGHISQEVVMADESKVQINMRLETVPTIHGMDVVMRLFHMDQSMYNFDRLGLSPEERGVVDDIISKPSGLVLIVGPTGSGKTTTLYSMLNTLNNSERKIITIEDPVEYQFEGMTQISVNSKTSQEMNFADRLRAVLRLDPDIIMVGEIRDMDTAKTALQASLTGHLVLSTFHAGSAAEALTRLMDVIGENPLFGSAIRLVMAQRLVRRLDDATKVAYDPDEHTLAKVREVVDSLPQGVERPSLEGLKLYNPGNSPENPFGYTGQIALREQFLMRPAILELFKKPAREVTSQDFEAAAIQDGMKTMLQDGILKAIRGETSLSEVYRVVG